MKQTTTKRRVLASFLSLALCVSMLVGSTYAWFTDTVTSSGNIIKSGTLDVGMLWADGDEDPDPESDNLTFETFFRFVTFCGAYCLYSSSIIT